MLIEKNDINNQALLGVFRSAYIDASMDDDGELEVDLDGMRIFVDVSKDKGFLMLRSMYGLKDDTLRTQALELCNRLNDKMVMVRFCCPAAVDHLILYADHFTVLEGGITGQEIVSLIRRFHSVIQEGIGSNDTEDVLR